MNEKRFTRHPDVVTRTIGEETLLVPVGQTIVDLSCLFTLNDTGNFIWEQLAAPATSAEIAAAVAREFDVTGEQAEQDVTLFIEELTREKCIVEVDTGEDG